MNTESINHCPKCQAAVPPEAPQGLCPKCLLAAASAPTEGGHAAASQPPPTLAALAAAFPQLEILEFIGQGGMGLVYKARQPRLDRFVALKLLPQKAGADPTFGQRFNREARVLARLSHPNIVAVHDFGQADDFCYLLMEFVDGVNLRQAMRAGQFTPAQALALVPKVCDALQYAHEEGVLHRDIKPENLLLDTRGRVKIADFGIAKLLGETKDHSLTASGAAVGTPHYMAPEQLERPQDVDQRADIYSLGVVLYEMLTGELPLGRFAPPSQKAPMDPRVDEVVLRALEKERERRFQSAGQVKTEIENITSTPAPAGGQPAVSAGSVNPGSGVPIGNLAQSMAAGPDSLASGPWGWFGKPAAAAALVAVSLVELVMATLSKGRPLPGEQVLMVLLIAGPGIAGTWLGVRAMRFAPRQTRDRRFALFANLAWPILLLNTIVIMICAIGLRGSVHPFLGILGVLTLLVLDGLMIRHWAMRPSREQIPLSDWKRTWGVAGWASASVLFTLLLIFSTFRSPEPPSQPASVVQETDPNPIAGYEIPPGTPLAADGERIFHTAVTVPAGYALTITPTLRSNQTIVPGSEIAGGAFLMAPASLPGQGTLTWRLLGNTTLADGAPLEFSLGSGAEPDSRRKLFHLIPPQPLSVDWVSEPVRVWPPQNGHTRFLILRGYINQDGERGTEWTVGIETRLDPIPPPELEKLSRVVTGLGTNWMATFQDKPLPPSDSARVELPSNAP